MSDYFSAANKSKTALLGHFGGGFVLPNNRPRGLLVAILRRMGQLGQFVVRFRACARNAFKYRACASALAGANMWRETALTALEPHTQEREALSTGLRDDETAPKTAPRAQNCPVRAKTGGQKDSVWRRAVASHGSFWAYDEQRRRRNPYAPRQTFFRVSERDEAMNNWRKGIATWQMGRALYISVPFTWLLSDARRIATRHKCLAGASRPLNRNKGPTFAESSIYFKNRKTPLLLSARPEADEGQNKGGNNQSQSGPYQFSCCPSVLLCFNLMSFSVFLRLFPKMLTVALSLAAISLAFLQLLRCHQRQTVSVKIKKATFPPVLCDNIFYPLFTALFIFVHVEVNWLPDPFCAAYLARFEMYPFKRGFTTNIGSFDRLKGLSALRIQIISGGRSFVIPDKEVTVCARFLRCVFYRFLHNGVDSTGSVSGDAI